MFPLSHMAGIFPYILLAAFYVMLVIRSSEADTNNVAAEETSPKSFNSQAGYFSGTSAADDAADYHKALAETLPPPCYPKHPPGTVYTRHQQYTLHKVCLCTGPSRAPPFV